MDRFLLQLMLTKGIGTVALKKIINFVKDNPKYSFELLCSNPQIISDVLINYRNLKNIIDNVHLNFKLAEQIFENMRSKSIKGVLETDISYPAHLKYTLGKNCPPVLFVKGNYDLLFTKAVGFCGSRKVSAKGSFITAQCANQLVNEGITVVSGYASGTDMAAHISAMKNGGNTVFVLAEGILRYTEKLMVRNYINSTNHVFVSQFLPNALWNVGNAMARNSIVLGLSQAMILVESGNKGGTFAAGEESLKKGVPLFVIDYAQPEVSAEANPYFISRGGFPIRSKNGTPNLEKVFSFVNSDINNCRFEQMGLKFE